MAAANPQVNQGTLNRLITSLVVPNFPQLNVTSPYQGKGGIRVAFQGNATTMLQSMTGAVTSPEPYQNITITANLLRTQSLAGLWKTQMELSTLLGIVNCYSDSSVLPIYSFFNCAIEGIGDLEMNGSTADFPVRIAGFYQINAALYSGL